MVKHSFLCLPIALAAILILIGATVADKGLNLMVRGCNGDFHGISCCYMGFNTGDNSGGKEIFIQPYEYTEQSCFENCKKKHPTSVGLTEHLHQKYTSGNGTNKNKCWCEFGDPRLNDADTNYQTCVFEKPNALALTKYNPVLRDCLSSGGYFFGHSGGRIRVQDRFKVGENLDMELVMKARSKDGLLLAVLGSANYLVLELDDGVLRFRVDNGDGAIVSQWKPDNPNKFLEETVKVQATKNGNIVRLTVDGVHASLGEKGVATNANIYSGLFIGGHSQPQLVPDFPGNFEGCIWDVTINNYNVYDNYKWISGWMLEGDVHAPTR